MSHTNKHIIDKKKCKDYKIELGNKIKLYGSEVIHWNFKMIAILYYFKYIMQLIQKDMFTYEIIVFKLTLSLPEAKKI